MTTQKTNTVVNRTVNTYNVHQDRNDKTFYIKNNVTSMIILKGMEHRGQASVAIGLLEMNYDLEDVKKMIERSWQMSPAKAQIDARAKLREQNDLIDKIRRGEMKAIKTSKKEREANGFTK